MMSMGRRKERGYLLVGPSPDFLKREFCEIGQRGVSARYAAFGAATLQRVGPGLAIAGERK